MQKSTLDRRDVIINTPKIVNSGKKHKPKATSSGVRSPSELKGRVHSLVPPLPIHMISNLSKEQQQKPKKHAPLQNSARSSHSKPPPPESFRSHRSRQNKGPDSARQDSNRDAGGVSRRSAHRTGAVESLGNSSQQNITGAIVNGALVNKVMLQANNKIGTSKFEKCLENSFEGDDATLVFDTERLKQFPDDYACYQALESTDQKILVKQWLFMKHERELKVQAKQEKEIKEQKRRERQAKVLVDQPKKKRQNSHGSGSNFNNSNRSFRSGISNVQRHQNHKARDVDIGQMLDISAIQLDSSLSEIGTMEKLKARAREGNLDAQLSEMMAVSQNISGLKTATKKELV